MGMLGLRYVFGLCGAGLLLAVTASSAFAASDHAPSARAPEKGAASSTSHHSAGAAHHRQRARPAPHQATTHKDHKKDGASRPAAVSPPAAADKSLDQRPLLGPFSLGVETDPKVKRRSIRGGEYDPDRDGDQSKGLQPPYLGFSLKAPFSW
jgi:hypothetical protein